MFYELRQAFDCSWNNLSLVWIVKTLFLYIFSCLHEWELRKILTVLKINKRATKMFRTMFLFVFCIWFDGIEASLVLLCIVMLFSINDLFLICLFSVFVRVPLAGWTTLDLAPQALNKSYIFQPYNLLLGKGVGMILARFVDLH